MSAYRKKPVVVEASQWFKNGDHPRDYAEPRDVIEDGSLQQMVGSLAKERGWEGAIVRYFRRPDVPGEQACRHCGQTMHVHGWIDTKEGGHVVCPGDWIITGVQGEHYPCKPDIFAATYEPSGSGLLTALRALEAELREQQEAHGRLSARGQVYMVVADRLAALLTEHTHD